MSEYDIQDSGGREMLQQACAAIDGIAECVEIISRDGRAIRTKSGPREHPLLKHELALRSFVVRTLHRLGLDVEPVKAVGLRWPWLARTGVSTNRTPISRPQKPHITDAMVELFITHETLRPQYYACLDRPCAHARRDKHCGDCNRYCNATHDLSVLLGAAPFQISGVDEPAQSRCPTPIRCKLPLGTDHGGCGANSRPSAKTQIVVFRAGYPHNLRSSVSYRPSNFIAQTPPLP